jgi:hypothetical protein
MESIERNAADENDTFLQRTATRGQPAIKFVRHVTGYFTLLSLFVSVLPLTGRFFQIVPTFAATRNALMMVATISCLFACGFMVFLRHSLVRLYFPQRFAERAIGDDDSVILRRLTFAPPVLFLAGLLSLFCCTLLTSSAVEEIAYLRASFFSQGEVKGGLDICRTQPVPADQQEVFLRAGIKMAGSDLAPFIVRCDYKWEKGSEETQSPKPRKVVHNGTTILFPDSQVIDYLLEQTPYFSVPKATLIAFLYSSSFVLFVVSIMLMSIREYGQKLHNLSDFGLATRPRTSSEEFDYKDSLGVYGKVIYSAEDTDFAPRVRGPYCRKHRRPLVASVELGSKEITWVHEGVERSKPNGDLNKDYFCDARSFYDLAEWETRQYREGYDVIQDRLPRKVANIRNLGDYHSDKS